MNKPHYRWVIVAMGALLGCVAMGSMFSLAVFLKPISDATGWSRTGISSAMTYGFITMAVASFGWGALMDRLGPRLVVVSGALLTGLGIALASRSTDLLQFQLAYGLIVAAGAGAILAPMIATTTGWFEKHRSLAVSLVSAGLGVAPLTMSPLAAWLISTNSDWRTAQLSIAIVAWALMLPAALLVRRAPRVAGDGAAAAAGAAGDPSMTASQALRSLQFVVLASTFFFCCAMHSGPIFHTISYAINCGVAPLTAVTIYSTEGLAGLGGRLVFGLSGDKYGARRVVVVALMIQVIAAGSYFFARQLGEFYAVAIAFGFAYGGVMPLYAVIAREYFPMRIMGTVFGAASMGGSLGMALGPAIGGWIFDTFHAYGYLYLFSCAMGLGAVAIALAFPAPPRRVSAELQAA